MSVFDRFRLDNQVAVITGAGRGIGAGIAVTYAEAGADVVLAARSPEQLEQTANRVRGLGRRALVVPTDVNRSEQLQTLADATAPADHQQAASRLRTQTGEIDLRRRREHGVLLEAAALSAQ